MDAAQVLEEYLSDLTNLPTDLAYILEEIHAKNEKLVEAQKRIIQRDGAIQKFIKAHGSLTENPKEASSSKIRSDFQESLSLQQDKCNLANTGLFLISRQVRKLNEQIKLLEQDGQPLPATVPDLEPAPMVDAPRSAARRPSELKRHSRDSTPLPARPVKRHRGLPEPRPRPGAEDGDEETHYCLCQQPSFGNMVGCDNADCQYEWFHYECVGLKEAPTGTWFCPACRVK